MLRPWRPGTTRLPAASGRLLTRPARVAVRWGDAAGVQASVRGPRALLGLKAFDSLTHQLR